MPIYGHTYWNTDRLTALDWLIDANRFYNLSDAIRYSCIGGATPRFFFLGGGTNLLPTTDVLQAMAYMPQHWDWGQTEITSPIFTLCSEKRDIFRFWTLLNNYRLDFLTIFSDHYRVISLQVRHTVKNISGLKWIFFVIKNVCVVRYKHIQHIQNLLTTAVDCWSVWSSALKHVL